MRNIVCLFTALSLLLPQALLSQTIKSYQYDHHKKIRGIHDLDNDIRMSEDAANAKAGFIDLRPQEKPKYIFSLNQKSDLTGSEVFKRNFEITRATCNAKIKENSSEEMRDKLEDCPSQALMDFLVNKSDVVEEKIIEYLKGSTYDELDREEVSFDIMEIFQEENPGVEVTSRDLGYSLGLMAGFIYLLTFLPPDVTQWDPSLYDNVSENYRNNVRSKPVIDEDAFAVNFIGHPLAGYMYCKMNYNNMRDAGIKNKWSALAVSFGVSSIMSTFFWEYGFEAFLERPSLIDLIVTPLFGSILCGVDVFFEIEKKIRKNGGKLLGSRMLGNLALFLLDPLGHTADYLNSKLSSIFPHADKGRLKAVIRLNQSDFLTRREWNYYGVSYTIPLN